ncbi:MAG TPA: hypothetical protein VJQ55_07190, partial [Candidatus Binatia bacterium]|nr:hypothetical protein [Candidatus Binatia bacterium]
MLNRTSLPKRSIHSSFVITLAGVMIFSTSAILSAQTSARPTRPLRIAYLSTSATMASVWMAKETGALAKEGLET